MKKRLKKLTIVLFLGFLCVQSAESESLEQALEETPKKTLEESKQIQQKITLENNVVFTNLVGDSLLIGTDFGEVLELKLSEKSPKLLTKLPNIKSFYSDSYAPKVYSVDRLGEQILIHSEGDYGAKNLFLFSQGELKSLPNEQELNIKKAAFVDKQRIFLGLASNEIVLYDLKQKKILYRKQLSEASFSDFALDLELGRYVVSCESGILYFGAIESGEVLVEMEGENKDNVYQVKLARVGDTMTFIAGGQDRRVGIYRLNLQSNAVESYGIPAEFLVYSVGLSADATLGAYMESDQSEIRIFRIEDKQEVEYFVGHMSLLNNIIFADSKLISSEDGKNIIIWNLKE